MARRGERLLGRRGVAEGDLSIRLWPAVARQNGIKLSSVKLSTISAAVREPGLMRSLSITISASASWLAVADRTLRRVTARRRASSSRVEKVLGR